MEKILNWIINFFNPSDEQEVNETIFEFEDKKITAFTSETATGFSVEYFEDEKAK